jgi:hypothetical protein
MHLFFLSSLFGKWWWVAVATVYGWQQEAGMQVYNPFSGCRNAVLSIRGLDTHSSALGLQTQH